MKYEFYTDCTNSTADIINYVSDNRKEIKYSTFLKYVEYKEVLEMFPQYERTSKCGLTIRNDWHISYYKSQLPSGTKCVFMVHSAIEYIWIKT